MNSYIENKIQLFIKHMIEYQKNNNIKGQCITNAQYLYDYINHNFPNINPKAKAVVCLGNDNENNITKCICHMVIMIDDIIYDPSYEIISLNDIYYFGNMKSFSSYIKKIPLFPEDIYLKTVSNFIEFIKLADKINEGGLLVCDKDFYNNQADYVEKKMHSK
jgi:hypothetical protein